MSEFEKEPNNEDTIPDEEFDVEMLGGTSLYKGVIELARSRIKYDYAENKRSSWWDSQTKSWTDFGYEAIKRYYGSYRGFDKVMRRVARELANENFE